LPPQGEYCKEQQLPLQLKRPAGHAGLFAV